MQANSAQLERFEPPQNQCPKFNRVQILCTMIRFPGLSIPWHLHFGGLSPMVAPQRTTIISLSRRTITISAPPHGSILSPAAGAYIRQAVKSRSSLAPSAFMIKMTVADAGIAGAAAGIQYPDFGAHLARLRGGPML